LDAASPAKSPAKDKAEQGEQGGTAGTRAPVAGGTGTGAQDGAGGSDSSGGSGPSGGGSAGPDGPGTSDGGTTTAPTPPASGTHRYRNGDNGRCITQVYGSSDHGDCSDPTARWTLKGRSDGNFKLVGRLWRTGPGGSLRSDYGGGCLDLGMSSGLVTKTCAGEASQRWPRQA
jgi:hypothetical protein